MSATPVRVLVVDDSALVRRAVSQALKSDPGLTVAGVAADAFIAWRLIHELNPDVITLDVEMPGMDGVTFLRKLMHRRPMPVVILSSVTGPGSQRALDALEAGAVDVISKPSGPFSSGEPDELIRAVKAAATARVRAPIPLLRPEPAHPIRRGRSSLAAGLKRRQLVLIGASTGGTEAIRSILRRLPEDAPAICIVQHIPAQFSGPFAERLNRICPMQVRQARDGDVVQQGLALVAPGGRHLRLERGCTGYRGALVDGPPVHHQRPAVDVLFESAVQLRRSHDMLGVLLTGMGVDGAAGLRSLRTSGANTIVQDESSCVVFGMPREAIRIGAAEQVLPLEAIPARILSWSQALARGEGTVAIPVEAGV